MGAGDVHSESSAAGFDHAVDDAVAPPPNNPRFPLLDGMRAVAAIAVVLVHVAWAGNFGSSLAGKVLVHMNIGVTIFFLISGFLLYRPFIAHRGGGPGHPRISSYAKRRLLRIFPAYWLILIVLILLPGMTAVPGDGWIQQFALIHTLPIGDGMDCIRNFDCALAPTWSLAVEFTFYAALPLYFLASEAVVSRFSPRRWLAVELSALAVLALASVLVRYVLVIGPASLSNGTVLGFTTWFGLGMAMAAVSVAFDREGRPQPRPLRLIAEHPTLIWAGAAAVFLTVSLLLPATSFNLTPAQRLFSYLGYALAALLAILPAVFGSEARGLPRAFLRSRLVAWLGLISYGIFLWHFAVVLELKQSGWNPGFPAVLALTLAITIPIAAASYYLVERPAMRFKYRPIPRPSWLRRGSSPIPESQG